MHRHLPKPGRFHRVRTPLGRLPSGIPTSSTWLVAAAAVAVPVITTGAAVVPSFGGRLPWDPGPLGNPALHVVHDGRGLMPDPSSSPISIARADGPTEVGSLHATEAGAPEATAQPDDDAAPDAGRTDLEASDVDGRPDANGRSDDGSGSERTDTNRGGGDRWGDHDSDTGDRWAAPTDPPPGSTTGTPAEPADNPDDPDADD